MSLITYLGLTTRLGPTTRYRILQYEGILARHGLRVDFKPLLDDGYMQAERFDGVHRQARRAAAFVTAVTRRVSQLRHLDEQSLVIVEREVYPFAPPVVELALARRQRGFVLELDDALYLTAGRRTKLRVALRAARHVVVGNEHLADFARSLNTSVHVIPTSVDTDLYRGEVAVRDRSPVRVGWIGLPTNFTHLAAISPAIAPLVREGLVQLVVCSARRPQLQFEHVFVPWRLEDEPAVIQDFDVGIMPLSDSAFARGKCGLKLLQYMAAARPVIASPVGVNRSIVSTSGAGTLASTLGEWTDAMRTLCTSASLRATLGSSGRRFVVTNYSLEVWGPRLATLYREWM